MTERLISTATNAAGGELFAQELSAVSQDGSAMKFILDYGELS
ncbi:hypothetical protein OS189_01555 [Sulfitobacter sp. F26169L]|nr:hypothetical protein [Sulfitobacter sp. F26169L]MCX7565027.1 hypothetical protein [Sulfitobacter sp. F26169L]